MTIFFFKEIPGYLLNKFTAVRDTFDNLNNLLNLAEIINSCEVDTGDNKEDDFLICVFSGSSKRVLIKKDSGYFSMTIPFQVIVDVEKNKVIFNSEKMEEEVNGRFISIMRNAIESCKQGGYSHEEIICSISEDFGMPIDEACGYYDEFASLTSEDHGYLRFDDDEDNADGDVHPRFHFDIFIKSKAAIKIGYDQFADMNCFYSLFDKTKPKQYFR